MRRSALANPCSGEASEGEAPTDTPGVTDDTVRIGVISDKENPAVPLPTVGIEDCFLYTTITDGEFVREHPDDGFDCDPDHLYTSDETFEN
ncbi:hypothetical protein BH24ACT4_BH24ACT4_18210 [soil metagenome]